jgi:hypothetical protein
MNFLFKFRLVRAMWAWPKAIRIAAPCLWKLQAVWHVNPRDADALTEAFSTHYPLEWKKLNELFAFKNGTGFKPLENGALPKLPAGGNA